MLTDNDVLHVANLAKLKIEKKEIELYKNQLQDILTEIAKINEVIFAEDEILITPNKNINIYNEDVPNRLLTKEEVLINANNKNDDYIIVPEVIECDI